MLGFARRVLIILAISAVLAVLQSVSAEEQTGVFVPKSFPGMAFTGSFSDDYKFTLTIDLPDAILKDAGIKKKSTSKTTVAAEYDHQTVSTDSEGMINACVRYYTKSYVRNVSEGKSKRDNIDMTGKKFFFKVGKETITYAPSHDLPYTGSKLILCDIEDPFQNMLPRTVLTKGMKWSINDRVFDKFLNTLIWYEPDEGSEGYSAKSAEGIVANLTPKEAHFDISFDASYFVTGTNIPYVYPLEGKMKLVYSLEHYGILSANLSMSGDCKVTAKSDDVEIPLILSHSEKFTMTRKYKGVSEGTKPPKGKTAVFSTCFGYAPQLVASLPEKGKLLLQANWNGSPCFEEINTSGFGVINELPTAAAFSPCGNSAIVAFGNRVFITSNTGKTFRPLQWANAPVVKVAFCKSEPPFAVIKCQDGSCFMLEVTDKTNAPSKITHPENKKIVHIAECCDFNGYYLYDGADIFVCPWGGKATKAKLALSKPISHMISLVGGLVFIAEDLYVYSNKECKKVFTGLSDNYVDFCFDTDAAFFLCNDGTMMRLNLETCEYSKMRDGVNSFSVRYNTLFMATDDGLIMEPVK